MAKYTVTCKRCGKTGLTWVSQPEGWRLFEAEPQASGGFVSTGVRHSCGAGAAPEAPPAELVAVATAEAKPLPAALVAPVAVAAPVKRISLTSKWHLQLEALLKAGSRRVLLVGPPGTGKSTTAALVAGAPRMTCTEGDSIADYVGMYQLRDGATVWSDALPIVCMRAGTPLVVDEVDHPSPEVYSFFYALFDDNPQMTLPTGEQVRAAETFAAIGTTNSNIASLPDAVADRIEAVVMALTPHPDALRDLPAAERNLVNAYFRGLDSAPWQWSAKPTARRVRSYSKLMASGLFEPEAAAALVFGTAGAEILSGLSTAGRGGAE